MASERGLSDLDLEQFPQWLSEMVLLFKNARTY